MSGTSRNGTIDLVSYSVAAPFIGRSVGIGLPFVQWEQGALFTSGSPSIQDALNFTTSTAGTRTNATQGTPTTGTNVARVGSDREDAASYNQDWFEKVHLLPKTKIDFGNIITLVQASYLIHSAFRRTSVTLAVITNNGLPGTNLPNMTAPLVLAPLETALDPTTTANGGGTTLGTLVQLKIQQLADGLPLFDTFIHFDFSPPANDVDLFFKGQRIVLMPMEYESPVSERLSWLTDIIEALDGREQRIALRKHPRQSFEVSYLLDGNDRQRMQALLLDWTDSTFGFPLWHERVFLTAAVSAGATTYQVTGADVVDFRVGGLAAIIQDNATFDVIRITALTATQITAADPSVNGYSINTRIVPLRTAILVKTPVGQRYLNKLEEFKLTFDVSDNDTGAVVGSTTPGWWTTYNSRVLFDDPNVVAGGTMREEFPRRVYRIDNNTGKVTQTSIWDRSKHGFEKGFVLRNRADIYTFRKLLTALCGKQKAFYIPSFAEDLTVAANIGIGTSTLDVTSLQYVRFVLNRLPMKVFRITFTDGTSLVRSVSSSATVSTTVERLTLDTTWPANRTIAEVSRVEFYELVRFDSDEVQITYPRIGQAYCTIPLLRVFDDN
jgi:hypothetical protein